MSFSSDLKLEISEIYPKSIHCRVAELAGIISVNGRLEGENSTVLAIRADNDNLEQKIIKLLLMITDINSDDIVKSNEIMHHRKLLISNQKYIDVLFKKLKLSADGTHIHVDGIITQKNCCKTAYLRGAFFAGGSISSPERAYQFEIVTLSEEDAEKMVGILSSLHMNARIVKRRDRYVVYIKDGDTISDVIGNMGASNSYMEFENIRILKDLRNSINREVNCDTANMAKTANAAKKSLDDIKFIQETVGLEALPESLKVAAEIRLQNPYLPLKDLGLLFTPPLGKSGINKRLRKISDFADDLRI